MKHKDFQLSSPHLYCEPPLKHLYSQLFQSVANDPRALCSMSQLERFIVFADVCIEAMADFFNWAGTCSKHGVQPVLGDPSSLRSLPFSAGDAISVGCSQPAPRFMKGTAKRIGRGGRGGGHRHKPTLL